MALCDWGLTVMFGAKRECLRRAAAEMAVVFNSKIMHASV